jgi:hypothetical protein
MDATELIARHRAAADAAASRLESRWWAGRLVWRPPPPDDMPTLTTVILVSTHARMTELKRHILMEVEPE